MPIGRALLSGVAGVTIGLVRSTAETTLRAAMRQQYVALHHLDYVSRASGRFYTALGYLSGTPELPTRTRGAASAMSAGTGAAPPTPLSARARLRGFVSSLM